MMRFQFERSFIAFWIFCAALQIGMGVGAIYVAVHFIRKYW